MNLFPLPRIPKLWLWGSVAIVSLVTIGTGLYYLDELEGNPPQKPLPVAKKVVALGRLEPDGGVIRLAAPLALDGDRVAELRVESGDRVKAGQIIAVLDSYRRLSDAVRQAQQQVRAAEAKLTQVKAGAKLGEINAQKETIDRLESEQTGALAAQFATIARLEAEVRNAQTEYRRFEQLYEQGAISTSERDRRRLTLDTAQAQLNEAIAKQRENRSSFEAQVREAKATLNRIAEVRPVDVQAAQTEVDIAIAALDRARTELEQAYVRAPKAGTILKVHTHPGEQIAATPGDRTAPSSGIVDFAPTSQMVAIAEVYQSDISKIKIGQSVSITGQVISSPLRGTVSRIGKQINRQTVFSNQPGENLDRRVVEVRIRIVPEDSRRVVNLTNLQVQTEIQL